MPQAAYIDEFVMPALGHERPVDIDVTSVASSFQVLEVVPYRASNSFRRKEYRNDQRV